jgi:hypothetical protein
MTAVRKVPLRSQKNRSPADDPRKKSHVPTPPIEEGKVEIRAESRAPAVHRRWIGNESIAVPASEVSRSAEPLVLEKVGNKAALRISTFINYLPVAGNRDCFRMIKDGVTRFSAEIGMHQIVIVKDTEPGGLRDLRECTPGVFPDRDRTRQAENA